MRGLRSLSQPSPSSTHILFLAIRITSLALNPTPKFLCLTLSLACAQAPDTYKFSSPLTPQTSSSPGFPLRKREPPATQGRTAVPRFLPLSNEVNRAFMPHKAIMRTERRETGNVRGMLSDTRTVLDES